MRAGLRPPDAASRLRREGAAIHVVGPVERRLVALAHAEQTVDQLDTLHAAVVLVGDLVLPGLEAAPRVDPAGSQSGQDRRERLVAAEKRRGVAVRLTSMPEAHHPGTTQQAGAPHPRERLGARP